MPPANRRTLQKREQSSAPQGGGSEDSSSAEASAYTTAAMIQAQAFEAIARKVNPEFYAQLEAQEQAQLDEPTEESPYRRKINWNRAKFWKWGRKPQQPEIDPDRKVRSPIRIVVTQSLPDQRLQHKALSAPNCQLLMHNGGYYIAVLRLPSNAENRATGKYYIGRATAGFLIARRDMSPFATSQEANLVIRDLGL
jgi:hypothetical protein